MTYDNLADGSTVFADANAFVYRHGTDPLLVGASVKLLQRAERGDIAAFTSTHVLSEVAHRLMLLEAAIVGARQPVGMLRYLRRHPNLIQNLAHFRQSVEDVIHSSIRVLPITTALISDAMQISQRHGLTNLASHDADFDRVSGLTRFAPA